MLSMFIQKKSRGVKSGDSGGLRISNSFFNTPLTVYLYYWFIMSLMFTQKNLSGFQVGSGDSGGLRVSNTFLTSYYLFSIGSFYRKWS